MLIYFESTLNYDSLKNTTYFKYPNACNTFFWEDTFRWFLLPRAHIFVCSIIGAVGKEMRTVRDGADDVWVKGADLVQQMREKTKRTCHIITTKALKNPSSGSGSYLAAYYTSSTFITKKYKIYKPVFSQFESMYHAPICTKLE
jgi:hypothetical protein